MHAELIATYRLQLNRRFTLADAARISPYLRGLGISHPYFSPVLTAVPGSDHGYDVCDPTSVSADLGGTEGLHAIFKTLQEAGQGCVIDLVPNHLAASHDNAWWWDVLKNGRASPHASKFDIEWEPANSAHHGKILLPLLGAHPGELLERGELNMRRSPDGEWQVIYGELRFPVNAEGQSLLEQEDADPGAVLDRQFYRLCHFRLASEEINYRRFFMVQSLAAVRMEDSAVRDATHARILEALANGPVDGLRIDHPDGLRDPAGYFAYLREQLPDTWIVAEKILETAEELPDWQVDGTTGYDFLQLAGGLWVDPAGEKALTEFYADFTGNLEPYGVQVREKKRRIIQEGFRGEVGRLARFLRSACEARRLDFPRSMLEEVITELVVCFPVYRTYVVDGESATGPDRSYIAQAIATVRGNPWNFEPVLLDVLEKLLCGDLPDTPDSADFIARFQQLTSPVMAKGVEDTALYCYDRLVSLNEVGGDPTRFGITPDVFHMENTRAHARWPLRMVTTSTHDTKRSEDVRARIAVLSELGLEWSNRVKKWAEHNFRAWQGHLPDRNAEYLLYQTLVGTWPITEERLQDYMLKACREASRYTTWSAPDSGYEDIVRNFVHEILTDPAFILDLEDFTGRILTAGRVNSLAQTLLKLTSPGIPDIYQGCEIWDNSLVDPDNRRPVDYEAREELLRFLELDPPVDRILEKMETGAPKMHVIRRALDLRRRHEPSFGPGAAGAYSPLLVSGPRLANVVAFRRGENVAVIVPRLTAAAPADWGDTVVLLSPGLWKDAFTGLTHSGATRLQNLLVDFPVALLEKIEPDEKH